MIWGPLLRRAALEFGLTPEGFWRLSLTEWRALTHVPAGPEPMSRPAFDALIAAYPD